MHATLATWALYGMLVEEKMCDLGIDKLRHKTEAIREINLKIVQSPGGYFSDELVGAVATMANFEVRRSLSPPLPLTLYIHTYILVFKKTYIYTTNPPRTSTAPTQPQPSTSPPSPK